MFQPDGHVLQDFARMEVEIEFLLMDRQSATDHSQLPALAWTWNQLAIWRKLDGHRCCEENVRLTFDLTRDLRRIMREVQPWPLKTEHPAGDLLDEYRPALLYHTLRAIGYSIPVFKRRLAVYSGSILLGL